MNAPTMKDSPWAKWATFITPKTSDKPTASKAHMPPVTSVLNREDGPAFAARITAKMKEPIMTMMADLYFETNARVLRFGTAVGALVACIVPTSLWRR